MSSLIVPPSYEPSPHPPAQHLDVSHNKLRVLPAGFGEAGPAALEFLHLQYNVLEALPEGFGGLRALRELHVASNRLETLPGSVGGLGAAERLHLTVRFDSSKA